tara:strand:- start:14169 stop:14414 length:246 start_codon:yes stop_codon:yes gene_type:complete
MSKPTHLNKEDLEKVQEHVKKLNDITINIGRIEVQKLGLTSQAAQLEQDFSEFQKTLEETYGKVSVNIEDGSLSEIKEEEK